MTAFSETPAACAETTEWLLGNAAPDLRDRAERHLSHCTRCQASKSRLEGLRAVAETTTPALDDLRRARMLAQLNPALDDLATRFAARARAPRGWPALVAGVRHRAGWLTAGLATLGLAAVAVVVISNNRAGGPGVDSTIAVGPYAIPRPETTPTPAASSTPKADAETRLVPFRITGLAPATTQNLLGGHFDKLDVPAGATVRAQLGAATRVSVIGPARLRVVSAGPAFTEVKLDEGTLIADYDHRAGGRLRITSPDGVTNVVGTLFSVSVNQGKSRVAVARGRVVVAASAGVSQVLATGQSWEIGADRAQAVSPEGWRLISDHEREIRLTDAADDRDETARGVVTPPGPVTAPGPPVAPVVPESEAAPSSPTAKPSVPSQPARPSPLPTPALAPPPVPLAPPAAVPSARDTIEKLYRAAEADMRRRDWASAERQLLAIVAASTQEPTEDVARYELAQLALRRGDRATAQRHLDDLLGSGREPALREPAGFLRCEIAAENQATTEASACFAAFRERHPQSKHDRAALAWQLRLLPTDAVCSEVRALSDEYLQRHPHGPEASLAADRAARCPQ